MVACTSNNSAGVTTTTPSIPTSLSTIPVASSSTTTTATSIVPTTALATTTTSAATNEAGGAFAAQADQVVADLAAGRFSAVTAKFDPLMKTQLSTSALQTAWNSYVQILGPYQSNTATVSVTKGQLEVERVTVTMANATGEVRVAFDPDGSIAGLYLLRAGAPPP